MKMFREYSQGQMFLLPPSLDEFVPENHKARIINDVVDTMDMPGYKEDKLLLVGVVV